jgi:hypothetical protein
MEILFEIIPCWKECKEIQFAKVAVVAVEAPVIMALPSVRLNVQIRAAAMPSAGDQSEEALSLFISLHNWRPIMHYRSALIATKVMWLVAALALTLSAAAAGEEGKYPDLRGQWAGVLRTTTGLKGQPSFDPSKAWGRFQEAPLTPEYQAILEDSIKDQEEGGFGAHRGGSCLGFGMPTIAYGFGPLEFIVTPEITYILINWVEHTRRIYTDGREWPTDIEPTLTGYSIGHWIDEDLDGRYDVLEVETRGPFKGPRGYDATGLPLHRDNQSISRSASISTRPTRMSCTTSSRLSIMPSRGHGL